MIKNSETSHMDLSNVCHYTYMSAIESILTKDKIKLWATRYGFFSDENECIWAREHIIPHLEAMHKYDENLEIEHRAHPYISSLTYLEDNMEMWKQYGDNGKGVSLVFDLSKIKKSFPNQNVENFMSCMPVSYANEGNIEETIIDVYNSYVDDFGKTNPIFDLMEVAAFIKKEDYEYENEFRICKFSYDGAIAYYTGNNDCKIEDRDEMFPNDVKFRTRESQLIPYLEIEIPKSALKGICIGYNCDFEKTKIALECLLEHNNYKNIEIRKSFII